MGSDGARPEVSGECLGPCRLLHPPPAHLRSVPILPSSFFSPFLPPRCWLWLVVFFCFLLLFASRIIIAVGILRNTGCANVVVACAKSSPPSQPKTTSHNVSLLAQYAASCSTSWPLLHGESAPVFRLFRPFSGTSLFLSHLLSGVRLRAVLQRRMRLVGQGDSAQPLSSYASCRTHSSMHARTGVTAHLHVNTTPSPHLHPPSLPPSL
jgi:hypothetical protein